MIRYALKCPDGHRFESWFQSAEGFEALNAAGHVECPDCGAKRISKDIMAPQVVTTRGRPAETGAPPPVTGPGTATSPPAVPDTDARDIAMAKLRAHIEKNSDYVGRDFASEARAIHEGTTQSRAIHGESTLGEAKALLEDGVPVLPLPFPPRAKTN